MPQYKGSGTLGRRKGRRPQPPLPPERVTMGKRYRQKGFGDTVKPVTETKNPDIITPTNQPSSERELMILQEYRREMRACDERACFCSCHCHAGQFGGCYKGENERLGHSRTPNPDHKKAHRECPKGDSHKW